MRRGGGTITGSMSGRDLDPPPADRTPPGHHPELDFDGRYRVERVAGGWFLTGPLFREEGRVGMSIPATSATSATSGDGEQLLEKYRDRAALLNAAVDAERRR